MENPGKRCGKLRPLLMIPVCQTSIGQQQPGQHGSRSQLQLALVLHASSGIALFTEPGLGQPLPALSFEALGKSRVATLTLYRGEPHVMEIPVSHRYHVTNHISTSPGTSPTSHRLHYIRLDVERKAMCAVT